MKYFYSYAHYNSNCPSCEGSSGYDAEFCYLSSLFEDKRQLLESIKENIGELEMYRILGLDAHGEVTVLSEIFEATKQHNVSEVKFNLDGFFYRFYKDNNQVRLDSNDEGYKRLYDEE